MIEFGNKMKKDAKRNCKMLCRKQEILENTERVKQRPQSCKMLYRKQEILKNTRRIQQTTRKNEKDKH